MFVTSKGRKVVHVEMEKQMFGQEMFAGTSVPRGHRELCSKGPRWGPPVDGPVQVTPVICDEGPFPGAGLPSAFFWALMGGAKVVCVGFSFPWVLFLKSNQLKVITIPKGILWDGKLCFPSGPTRVQSPA